MFNHMTTKILRLPEVQAQSGYARSTIYLRIAQGLWTKPVQLGLRSVGWPAHEIDALNKARIASYSTMEISNLVKQLEENRKAVFQEVAQ